jgi:dTMP kinase
MFIVLEGVDGSGKSTLAARIAESLPATLYSTPPECYRGVREKVDRDASAEVHYAFYLDAVHEASREISLMLKDGENVVCDRYWATTYIYHKAMGLNISLEDFRGIVQPDFTVLLSVNSDVQIVRLLQRGMSAGDRRMLEKQPVLLDLYVDFLKRQKNFLHIDTSFLSQDRILKVVMSAIG